MAKQSKDAGMNSKKVVKEAAEQKRVITLNDRVKLEVIKETKHYNVGDIIEPHRVFAEELIKNKVAKEA